MKPKIIKAKNLEEFYTDEKCYIAELINAPEDNDLSIARARVTPGVTTVRHKLDGTSERYVVVAGMGIVEVEGLTKTEVTVGDLVLIPPDTPQRITNTGETDLVFLCICTPGFRTKCYTECGE